MRNHFETPKEATFDAASVFHAALGDESWEDVLKAYSDAVGAVVFLTYPDAGNTSGYRVRTHRYDMSVFDDGPFDHFDQWDPDINPFIRPIASSCPCRGIDRREIISDHDGERHPFIRQAAFAQDIYHSRYASLASVVGGLCGIWIGQSKRRGPIEGPQQTAFDASLRHFQAALRTRGMITEKDEVIRNLQSAIDRLHHGFLALDQDLRIIVRNRAADAILSSGDGISERGGYLRLHYASDQSAAEDAARAIARFGVRASHHGMPVRRPSMLPPYRATFAPSEGLSEGLGASKSVAIVTLSDPMFPKEPEKAQLLADHHGLTVAEARVTRLAALGLTKHQIGEELGLTENTVRTQLASAREKVGAANIAQLAFLIG